MRRKDKEIKDIQQISRLIEKCRVCRIGMAKGQWPYIVPVSFGYDGQAIFFHTAAQAGMKGAYLAANNRVCFEFEYGVELAPDEQTPCGWSFRFQSVIGFGRVEELHSREAKVDGLAEIMAHYSDQSWDFAELPLHALRVWKITIEEMSGKQSL
ncbi:pyridoxamine 5'-phosphate oxidase family protein [Desulfogranum mediterraneum]|uniref:pyridoxamine 5'-phosphate oxidase family protein n=1 Tax=Desulfogranum mediterraneum TaxID=160661 RepID=UPI00048C2DE5|nr:pyridoxamine 5'-phosphate oxidase family protein [Desulfogranum mediterraneum]